jgi:hypothetical protein
VTVLLGLIMLSSSVLILFVLSDSTQAVLMAINRFESLSFSVNQSRFAFCISCIIDAALHLSIPWMVKMSSEFKASLKSVQVYLEKH